MESITVWKKKPLLITHGVIIALFLLWLIPAFRSLFITFDIKAAYFFNDLAKLHPFWQTTWAIFNCKKIDWLYDVVILSFLIPYVCIGEKEKRLDRALHILLLLALTGLSFLFINRLFFGKLIAPKRLSPTGILTDLFRLSSAVPWIVTKEFSRASFPADHASTIFMFIVSQFHLKGKQWGCYAILVSLLFAIPRLITGAHWWSDLFLGSLPIALICQAWFFYTPLCDRLTHKIATLMRYIWQQKTRINFMKASLKP